jgi:ketosteroid isomerase-like protein
MMKQQQSWNEGNIEEFMSSYWKSDSLMFIGKNGIQYGWQKTLDNYKNTYRNKEEMGKLNFTNLDCKPLDSQHHQITGNWKLIRNDSLGDLSGYYTLLWKKIEDRWVIVYDHTN